MSLNQKLSKLRVDGNITDNEYQMLKQKTGHWIRKENEFFAPSRFYPTKEIVSTCSICNAHYLGDQKDFKYCPNCGAKMTESEG